MFTLCQGSAAERMYAMNASRGVERTQPMFDFSQKSNEDVFFDLVEQEKVVYGQPFNVTFQMQVRVIFKNIELGSLKLTV